MRTQPNKSIGESESHRRTAITYRKHKLTARHLKPAKRRTKTCKPMGVHPKKVTFKCILSVHEVSNDHPHTVKIIRGAPTPEDFKKAYAQLKTLVPERDALPASVQLYVKSTHSTLTAACRNTSRMEDTGSREPETLLPLPPVIASTQGNPSTLHRRAALAEEGLLPPLSPEAEAQVALARDRVKDGAGTFTRLRARSFENQQTEDSFQQGSARVIIDREAISKRLTPIGERLQDRLMELRKPPLKNWEEPPERYEED